MGLIALNSDLTDQEVESGIRLDGYLSTNMDTMGRMASFCTTLYTPPDFWRSYPVLIAAEYTNVSLRVVSGGPEFCSETGHATPYFLNRFPQGKVPVLVADSGFCVQGSNAAAYYVSNDLLRGSSRKEAVLVQQWINFAENELIPPVAAWVLPSLGIMKSSKLVTEHAKADVKKLLLLLNDHLHLRTYLVGEHITLADLTLVCAMLGLYKQVLEPSLRERYADVNRWFTTCVHQPPFQKVLGEVKFYDPATKPLEAQVEQEVTKEAARAEICLVATPKNTGSNEEDVSPVNTRLGKEVASAEVDIVGSSVEGELVIYPLKDRPARVESLIDASEEELSVVCASMEDKMSKVKSVVSSREEGDRISAFKDIGTKEVAASAILVDFSEETVCITGPSKKHGLAKKETVVGVQVEGVFEETKLVEIFNQLETTVSGSAEKATAVVTLTSFLGEDKAGNVEVSLVEESETEICTAGASEEGPVEVNKLDVPKCHRGVEEAATVELRMVGASGKDSSVDLKMVDRSKPDGPPKEEVTIMGASKDGLAREVMGGVCMAGSLKEVRTVALSTLDSPEKDTACEQEATSAVVTFEEDKPTTVVGLLGTSEEVCVVDALLEHESVVANVADALKDNRTTVDTFQGGKLATEEPMVASGECGDEWDSAKSADQLKTKDPFAHLPQSAFVLDEFKRKYSNDDISSVALPYLWDHFDKEGWSVWYMEYKYPRELSLDIMSSNLISGMFQRLDGMRKHSFASVILFGTDGDCVISGIWILRGQQFASELNEDWRVICEPYSWKKLDVDTDECKVMVNEYFMMEGMFRHMGKPFNQGKIFK
ncbi:elongation factor 1-gamma-like [Heterodontus francisci]|uniref:elongation factor 1-gamma-like n=1 Tax=Heterodontus francisci TaxID=7792 RepID=UPI00355C4934